MTSLQALSVVFLLSLSVQAEEPPPAEPQAPPPAPEAAEPPAELHELIGLFGGAWSCAGLLFEPGSEKGRPFTSVLEVGSDLGGFWLAGTERRQAESAGGSHVRLFFWSYDPIPGQYAGGWIDSVGGWSSQTSFGWQQDQLTMFGPVSTSGVLAKAKEVFTRPVEGRFTRTYDIAVDTDKWVRSSEQTCSRH